MKENEIMTDKIRLYIYEKWKLGDSNGRTLYSQFDCICGRSYPIKKSGESINVEQGYTTCSCGRHYKVYPEYVEPTDKAYQCKNCKKLVDFLFNPYTSGIYDYKKEIHISCYRNTEDSRKYNDSLCLSCIYKNIEWMKESIELAEKFKETRKAQIEVLRKEIVERRKNDKR